MIIVQYKLYIRSSLFRDTPFSNAAPFEAVQVKFCKKGNIGELKLNAKRASDRVALFYVERLKLHLPETYNFWYIFNTLINKSSYSSYSVGLCQGHICNAYFSDRFVLLGIFNLPFTKRKKVQRKVMDNFHFVKFGSNCSICQVLCVKQTVQSIH